MDEYSDNHVFKVSKEGMMPIILFRSGRNVQRNLIEELPVQGVGQADIIVRIR